MEDIMDRVEDRLKKKHAVYKNLVDILEKESEILKSADPGELWRMSSLKHDAAKKIENLRKEILGDLDTIAPDHGMIPGRFSSSKVLEFIPKDAADRIAPLCLDIEKLKKAVFDLSVTNVKFTEEYLQVIEELVAVFADAASGSQGYRPSSNAANLSGAIFRARV